MADDDLVTKRGLRIPAVALRWWAARSGGPGGQHANTSDTHVTVELDLDALDEAGAALPAGTTDRLRAEHGGSVRATAADSRSQHRNRQLARRRLAEIVDEAARPPAPPRRRTRPTRSSERRRLEEKRQRSEVKRGRSWRPGRDG